MVLVNYRGRICYLACILFNDGESNVGAYELVKVEVNNI